MEDNLLISALNLTMLGMGFVFLFLSILVIITKFMSYIITKSISNNIDNSVFDIDSNMIDEEAKFVIEQAIKMHRGA